jgi:hypothetical protein
LNIFEAGYWYSKSYFVSKTLIRIALKMSYSSKMALGKEIVERRHGEPIKFLFLPKMGLLGSQAGNEKNYWL